MYSRSRLKSDVHCSTPVPPTIQSNQSLFTACWACSGRRYNLPSQCPLDGHTEADGYNKSRAEVPVHYVGNFIQSYLFVSGFSFLEYTHILNVET